MTLQTNRDLYLFVSKLGVTNKKSLEEYLRTLWSLAQRYRDRGELKLHEFAALLEQSFVQSPPVDAPAPSESETLAGFAEWERAILAQIRDLREMAAAGTLEDQMRYFGVNAPSGARWYNFDPSTYLECAMAGTFGGWDEGDDTGRMLVPGKVAVLDAQGQVHAVDPQDIVEPVQVIDGVDWQRFIDFIWAGQCYE
jgi:hypothetical protein